MIKRLIFIFFFVLLFSCSKEKENPSIKYFSKDNFTSNVKFKKDLGKGKRLIFYQWVDVTSIDKKIKYKITTIIYIEEFFNREQLFHDKIYIKLNELEKKRNRYFIKVKKIFDDLFEEHQIKYIVQFN